MAMREAVGFPKRAGKEFTKNAIGLLVAYAPIAAILTLTAGEPPRRRRSRWRWGFVSRPNRDGPALFTNRVEEVFCELLRMLGVLGSSWPKDRPYGGGALPLVQRYYPPLLVPLGPEDRLLRR